MASAAWWLEVSSFEEMWDKERRGNGGGNVNHTTKGNGKKRARVTRSMLLSVVVTGIVRISLGAFSPITGLNDVQRQYHTGIVLSRLVNNQHGAFIRVYISETMCVALVHTA